MAGLPVRKIRREAPQLRWRWSSGAPEQPLHPGRQRAEPLLRHLIDRPKKSALGRDLQGETTLGARVAISMVVRCGPRCRQAVSHGGRRGDRRSGATQSCDHHGSPVLARAPDLSRTSRKPVGQTEAEVVKADQALQTCPAARVGSPVGVPRGRVAHPDRRSPCHAARWPPRSAPTSRRRSCVGPASCLARRKRLDQAQGPIRWDTPGAFARPPLR